MYGPPAGGTPPPPGGAGGGPGDADMMEAARQAAAKRAAVAAGAPGAGAAGGGLAGVGQSMASYASGLGAGTPPGAAGNPMDPQRREAMKQAMAARRAAGGFGPPGAGPPGAGPMGPPHALQPWQQRGLGQATAQGNVGGYLEAHPGVQQHMDRVQAMRAAQERPAEIGGPEDIRQAGQAPSMAGATGDAAQDQARLAAQARGGLQGAWAGARPVPGRMQAPASLQGVRPMPRPSGPARQQPRPAPGTARAAPRAAAPRGGGGGGGGGGGRPAPRAAGRGGKRR